MIAQVTEHTERPTLNGLAPAGEMARGAQLSRDQIYRYALWRIWDRRLPRVIWIMLNPSTADAQQDDPTVRRCLSFSREWGYGSLTVLNLFAARATDPKQLATFDDPSGPMNDVFIRNIIAPPSSLIVCAWGAHASAARRVPAIREMLRITGKEPMCLGITKDGQPRHPLYVPAATPLVRF
ncbi:MAG: hypothetical protein JWO59_698 [Chloroflexi bacterium]|nr:hypothetical protein [Chloroflexota bacterium]